MTIQSNNNNFAEVNRLFALSFERIAEENNATKDIEILFQINIYLISK